MQSLTKDDKIITIAIGASFSAYGIVDIRAFDESSVILNTTYGKICVEGNNMKIESLTKEDGRIVISGDISGVFCQEQGESKRTFLKRIFG